MKQKGCLIGMTVFLAFFVVIAIGLWKALTPWSLADKDPRQMVELFICDPAPKSVSDIEADGVIAFAGGEAFISFRIDPSDVESMIKRGGFRPADDRCPNWVKEFEPESGESISERYIRGDEFGTQAAIFISPGRKKCWFLEIHL
jgi:hypothetical protein